MCSDTRRSMDTARGFWFVGLGKRLTGDPEEGEEAAEALTLGADCLSLGKVLESGLIGDLSRGLSRVT